MRPIRKIEWQQELPADMTEADFGDEDQDDILIELPVVLKFTAFGDLYSPTTDTFYFDVVESYLTEYPTLHTRFIPDHLPTRLE